MKNKIVIVDYGMGNLGSIENMLKFIGKESIITSDKSIIKKSSKIILPGVGHFERAMNNLRDLSLIDLLKFKALDEKVPFLGICLGMQLMCNFSEEGNCKGLGIINADVVKFRIDNKKNKIPHMGWNTVDFTNSNLITKKLNNESRFYFVHSFHVNNINENNILFKTNYEIDFASGITNNYNIFGVQFHPEKSHKFGVQLFNNFANEY